MYIKIYHAYYLKLNWTVFLLAEWVLVLYTQRLNLHPIRVFSKEAAMLDEHILTLTHTRQIMKKILIKLVSELAHLSK